MKRIGIIGAGWLGIDLVDSFVKSGNEVYASYRSGKNRAEILAVRGNPCFLDLNADKYKLDFFENLDCLIICVPPYKVHAYSSSIKNIVAQAERYSISKIIFTSSTSVYIDDGNATEEQNLVSMLMSNVLLQAENSIATSSISAKYILRLAGLIGKGRHPAKFMSNKVDVAKPFAAVNLVQKSDVIALILFFVENNVSEGLYNICANDHPTRKDYYESLCQSAGMALPAFKEEVDLGKIVSSQKLELVYPEFVFRNIWDAEGY